VSHPRWPFNRIPEARFRALSLPDQLRFEAALRLPEMWIIMLAYILVTVAAFCGVAVPMIWQDDAPPLLYAKTPLIIYCGGAVAGLIALIMKYKKK